MHRGQVRREPWPDFDAFDARRYPQALRDEAAAHWAERARAEHGSVHQFTQVSHALCVSQAPLPVLGALARLITDEVRHVELCRRMALACQPSQPPQGERPVAPWEPPPLDAPAAELEAWAARAILIACCLGETISRPMLQAIARLATDPVAEATALQILRDEQLHATFGWETLALLLPRLDDPGRASLQACLGPALRGFEHTTACGVPYAEVSGTTLQIQRDPAHPNLGTLTPRHYAQIFYATLEAEVFPKLRALGLDPLRAWRGE